MEPSASMNVNVEELNRVKIELNDLVETHP